MIFRCTKDFVFIVIMLDFFLYFLCFIFSIKIKVFLIQERLVYVTSFNTVQGFWAVYQHLKLPSHLRQGCDYMFFRSGIQPYWESKENKNGGRFAEKLVLLIVKSF